VSLTSTSQEQEHAANELLAFAAQCELEGANLYAYVIYDAVAKTDIVRKGQALIGESRTQVKMPSRESYARAEKKFQDIVAKYDRPTVFRATALRYLAETNIALKKFEDAEGYLEEASRIQTDQGSDWQLGATVLAQSLVHAWKGEFVEANEKLRNAKLLFKIGAQEMRVTGLSTEAHSMISPEEVSLFTAAGIS